MHRWPEPEPAQKQGGSGPRLSYSDLSRTVSHALRHEPWLYELEPDAEGWVPVAMLLEALRPLRPEWAQLTPDHLRTMIKRAGKQRHELQEERIRARYGHTLPGRLSYAPVTPPAVLYHGTAPAALTRIRQQGLQPMLRQYVHSSPDPRRAHQVGARKAPQPVVLTIDAGAASAAGVGFYRGNDQVWLSDPIPVAYIRVPEPPPGEA